MKTTVDLPEEIVREVKLRAVLQRMTVKDLVADLLRQSLGMAPAEPSPQPTSTRIIINERGLPVIRCGPNAPAATMSIEELLALEQDALTAEDLQRAGISV